MSAAPLEESLRLLNDLVNNGRSKKRKGIRGFKVEDSIIENPAEAAEHFNSYICSVGVELVTKIPRNIRSPISYIGQSNIMLFYAGPASNIEVE